CALQNFLILRNSGKDLRKWEDTVSTTVEVVTNVVRLFVQVHDTEVMVPKAPIELQANLRESRILVIEVARDAAVSVLLRICLVGSTVRLIECECFRILLVVV